MCVVIALIECSATQGASASRPLSANETESAITVIANNLNETLSKARAKNVIVFDLTTSNGSQHPVGKWIADQLSLAISGQNPKITMIDRSRIARSNEKTVAPKDEHLAFEREMDQARSLSADVAISGDFAAVAGKIGVSLNIIKLSQMEKTHAVKTGVIPLSPEIAELADVAIPGWELEGGVPRAGKGGISMPICTVCVPPSPVPGERGTVKLDIVVAENGRPLRIKVIESPSHDLQEVAIRAVRQWRFKPSTNLDGRPIAVVVPVEINSP